MSQNLGSNDGSLASYKGDIIADTDAPLLSTDSTGGKSYALGSSLSAGIYTMVQNGTFKATPPDPDAAIVEPDNALPYFSLESNYVSGAQITATSVEDSTAASGRKIRFTIPVGTAVGQYLRFVRYVAIPGSVARTFTYQPRSAWKSTSSTAQVSVNLQAQFYQNDIATTIGTSETRTATLTTIAASTWAYEVFANPNSIPAIPSDAAFIRVAVGVTVSTLTTSAWTVDLHEVRIDHGGIQLLLSDQSQPGVYGYGTIYLYGGVMWIRPNEIATSGSNPSIYLDSTTGNIGIDPTSTGSAQILGSASVTGNLSTSGDHNLQGDLNIGVSDTSALGAIIFKGGNGGSIRAFSATAGNDSLAIKSTNGSTYAPLVADTFFPGGQGSFRLDHDGNFDLNDSLDVTGNITATGTMVATGDITGSDVVSNGVFYNDQPLTSTLTTNGVRFTLISGSLFRLDRITSSARFKTDIVDAGNEVLEASRRVHARHYKSTISHENGGTRLGFIAEELMDAGLDHAVGVDEEGRPDTIDPVALIAALWKRVEDLEARLAEVEGV
jgi:hypothetical protein